MLVYICITLNSGTVQLGTLWSQNLAFTVQEVEEQRNQGVANIHNQLGTFCVGKDRTKNEKVSIVLDPVYGPCLRVEDHEDPYSVHSRLNTEI